VRPLAELLARHRVYPPFVKYQGPYTMPSPSGLVKDLILCCG
jgi:hypothetical protein